MVTIACSSDSNNASMLSRWEPAIPVCGADRAAAAETPLARRPCWGEPATDETNMRFSVIPRSSQLLSVWRGIAVVKSSLSGFSTSGSTACMPEDCARRSLALV
eukprot:1184340-Prorocentrum_minimum.AAC.3